MIKIDDDDSVVLAVIPTDDVIKKAVYELQNSNESELYYNLYTGGVYTRSSSLNDFGVRLVVHNATAESVKEQILELHSKWMEQYLLDNKYTNLSTFTQATSGKIPPELFGYPDNAQELIKKTLLRNLNRSIAGDGDANTYLESLLQKSKTN